MNVAAGRERLAVGHGAGAGGAALPHGGRHRLVGSENAKLREALEKWKKSR